MGKQFKKFKASKKFRNQGAGKEYVSEENAEQVIKDCANKSENELMGQIVDEYTKGVKDGRINREELDAFVKNAKSMLSDEQMKKLNKIVSTLRKIK